MPWNLIIPAVISAAGGVGSALINKSASRAQPTTSTGTSTQAITPIEDPSFGGLKSALLGLTQQNLTAPLPAGMEETGIQKINEAFDLTGQGLQTSLAGRDLMGSPMAANALTKLAIGRAGQIGQFEAGLPALERQYQQDALKNALVLYASQPKGTSISGTTASQGTTIYPGSALGSGVTDAASMLAFLYGMGLFDQKSPSEYGMP
jgi:hypothetical protein